MKETYREIVENTFGEYLDYMDVTYDEMSEKEVRSLMNIYYDNFEEDGLTIEEFLAENADWISNKSQVLTELINGVEDGNEAMSILYDNSISIFADCVENDLI